MGNSFKEIDWDDIARSAYGAYAAVTDNKNFRGEDMPAFEALPEKIREAWKAAVKKVDAILWQVSDGG